MTPNPVVTEDDEDDDDKDVKNLQPSSQGCHERRRQWSLFTKHIVSQMENQWGFAVILWNTTFRFQKGSGMIWIHADCLFAIFATVAAFSVGTFRWHARHDEEQTKAVVSVLKEWLAGQSTRLR